MSITYRRDVPRTDVEAQREEADHIIAHLSACCSPMDSETEFADEVSVQLLDHPDETMMVSVVGFIDRDPDAYYLRPDFGGVVEPDYPETRYVPEVL